MSTLGDRVDDVDLELVLLLDMILKFMFCLVSLWTLLAAVRQLRVTWWS